jgi:hypothetical protein
MTARLLRSWHLVVALTTLAACGGGGSDAPPPPAPPPATGPASSCVNGARYALVAPSSAAAGRNAAAALLSCTGNAITQPRWTAVSGPTSTTPTLLSDKTQTLSVELTTPGTYTFSIDFVDPDGVTRSERVTIPVAGSPDPNRLVLRASQSVRMGGKVSVRAWPQAGDPPVSWQQVEGPPVTLDTRDPRLALFTAPNVDRDTVIRLRATATVNGVAHSDEVLVLVERYTQAPPNNYATYPWSDAHVSRVYPYRPASPYASALVPCVYDAAQRHASTCLLSRLPFLAQEAGVGAGGDPSIDQVMNRVLVSHNWLGRNFEEFLRTQDTNGDFRRMLKSVTAIVLGAQVRPSFYSPATGAIYLDGDNFWITPEERDTVNEAPDFRSAFGQDLQFSGLWRYVKNNQSHARFFDPEARVTRTQDDVQGDSAWLMYHELLHALDFLPPSAYAGLDSGTSVWGNLGRRSGNFTSNRIPLVDAYRLRSQELQGLGQVRFQGAASTALQRSYTPLQVGQMFEADLANDTYAYSTPFEDTAMALEEALMRQRLGVHRDVAFTDRITDTTTRENLFVRWGLRGRVGDVRLKPRVKAIAAELTPWFPPTAIDDIAAPLPMRAGETWFDNLVQPASPLSSAAQKTGVDSSVWTSKAQRWQFRKELQRMRHHRHVDLPRGHHRQPH